MIKSLQNVRLKEWFGDFGGKMCINDTAFLRLDHPELVYEKILPSEDFEEKFRDVINTIVPSIKLKKFSFDGRNITIIPRYGKYYSIAGHIALALALKKNTVYAGVYSKDLALVIGELCKKYNLSLEIYLGRNLGTDFQLVNYLSTFAKKVNTYNCQFLFDLPFAYIEVPFTNPLPGIVIQATANYGAFPGPALAGVLANIYGEDIKKMTDEMNIDTVVVPIVDGTEALSLFKTFKDKELATVEECIASEIHLIDHNCYTLSVRRADYEDDMNISLCPELVDMWRKCKVKRLGADKILKQEYSTVQGIKLNDLTKRAILIALEGTSGNNILMMEA